MIYLSGHPDPALRGVANFGYLLTPYRWGKPDLTDTVWAADTGCYRNPDKFDEPAYLAWLAGFPVPPLFATAPDRVGDWRTTLEVSRPVLESLRARGVTSAFIAQDGLEPRYVPWSDFNVLFIGGTTEWKLSPAAHRLAQLAREQDKWVHMGRVNTLRRLRIAQDWGCDSVDGNYLSFGPNTNRHKLMGRVQWIHDQKQLFS